MRPIPKKLLIHSGTIKSVTSKDIWGKDTTSDPVDLTYIRVEPTTKIIKDKQNNEIQLSATLFYDCKNSEPKNVLFTQDTIITINDKERTIKTIEPLYDEMKLHHYEIGLM